MLLPCLLHSDFGVILRNGLNFAPILVLVDHFSCFLCQISCSLWTMTFSAPITYAGPIWFVINIRLPVFTWFICVHVFCLFVGYTWWLLELTPGSVITSDWAWETIRGTKNWTWGRDVAFKIEHGSRGNTGVGHLALVFSVKSLHIFPFSSNFKFCIFVSLDKYCFYLYKNTYC